MHREHTMKMMSMALIVSMAVGAYAQDAAALAETTPKSCIGRVTKWDPEPAWWEKRHAQKLAQIAESGGEFDVVFVGDSITHNWEGARGPGSDYGGKPLAEMRKKYTVLNLGYGGDATQNVLWRLLNGELDGYTAKCFVLMIGTNNGGKPENTAAGIKAILDMIAERQPLAKVILHPIFPSGATSDHAWRVRNSKVNALIRPFADGKRIIWCDFNDRLLNADGTLKKELYQPDDLHPAPPAYDIWAEELAPLLEKTCRGVAFDFAGLSAEMFEKDLGGVNLLPPERRGTSPVKLVGSGKGPQDDAAQWRSKIVFGSDATRRLRIRFHYRASPVAGKPGRSIMFLFAKEFNDKGYLHAVIGQTDEFFHLFSREFSIPQSVREIDLCLRVESHGTLEFKNIEAVEVKEDPSAPEVELFTTPHGWLGRDFAVSSNGLAIVNYMWRGVRAREEDAKCRYEFVVTLPTGFRCVAPMNALAGTVREKTLPDGGVEVRYRTSMRPPKNGTFDWWGRQGLIVGTTAPHGTRGKAKFRLEIDGRAASNEESLDLFVIPEIKAQVPEKFLHGVSFASSSGLLSGNAAADEAYARFMVGCGVRWVKGWGRKINPFDMWRRAGIKHAMAESPIGNAYSLYYGTAPKGERFEALHPTRSRWLEHAICPVAVYREKPFFLTNVVARINDVHAGADGSYANWEPFFYRREGCMCESCRDEFARWARLPREDVAKDWPDCIAREGRFGDRVVKFRSWQCAEVVRTLDKWIRKATGGESSLGLIPAVHHEQITRNWVGVVDNDEYDMIDYGKDLAWACPWGPYSGVWDASSPFVNPGTRWLMDFYNAREGAEAAHRDYPGLKLMAYPHGLQCSSWLIEPEILGLNLSAYFFNGWDAALVYFFPMGYDSRYWKAYSDAVSLAAKWEGFIADAERIDGKVEIRPGADWPKPDAKAFHRTIASFRNVSFLQHVAYMKGDELLVAVFNYHPDRRAFFTLRHDGVETHLSVPPARVKVFTFRSEKNVSAAHGRKLSYWSVRKDAAGYWTFVDPKGKDVFIRGVEQVVWRGHGTPDGHIPDYRTHNIATFPNRKAWADDAEAKLRKWGFNTLGSWSDESLRGRGFGHFVHVGFAWPPLFMADEDRDLMIVRKTGRFFPNVFSPRWVYHCKTLAKARLVLQGSDFDLIGIYLDGELPWWGENGCPDREVGLCDVICAQPAGHTARKAYEEFMAARADGGSRAAKLDFMKLIAEKYFATTTEAIRRIDNRHMIVGCMFAGLRGYGPFTTMEACAKYCDVVTIDIYPPVDLERGVVLKAGTDLADVKGDLTDKELFREIDRIGKIINKPFHVTEWSFPAVEGGFPCVSGGGMRFRTQHERALASRLFAEMMNASPSIAGYNYFMWVDGQNRPTGLGYCNYGLMNEAGEPYAELIKMFEDFHAGADAARKKGYPAKRRWVDALGPVVPASSFAVRTIVGADGKGMLESFDFKNVTLIMKLRTPETQNKWEWKKFSFEKPAAEDKEGNAICRTYRLGSPRGRIRFEATLRNWFRDDTHEALTELVSIENKGEPFEMGALYWRFTPPKPLATRVCAMPPSWCTWRPWVDLSIPWGERTLRILSPENSVYGDTRPGTGEGCVPPELGYVISCTIASGETWHPKDAAYYIFRLEDSKK